MGALRSVGFACMVVGGPAEGTASRRSAGFLLPIAGGLAIVPLFRTGWRRRKPRSALWTVAALPGAGAALLLVSLAMETVRPRRGHRSSAWRRPSCACIFFKAVAGWLYDVRAQWRERLLTPPEPAAPSDPPRPDRPTCT
ncbi:hypothetical protein [Streptomyces sp. KN37]|uniref:hypothetical protein n=1 Tax=Streptomyces sp. KN37 TaxID=3090667 RepID=UPI002A75C2E9|nr:hypothetical protein [Streptomyces sp. KN37]WPO72141.1 hypothetical protein R9806_16610 [Streptomyces sp. KN37]